MERGQPFFVNLGEIGLDGWVNVLRGSSGQSLSEKQECQDISSQDPRPRQ